MCSVALQVSKQKHRAHVILATSEYSFITWLTQSGYLDFALRMLTLLRTLTVLLHLQNWAVNSSRLK